MQAVQVDMHYPIEGGTAEDAIERPTVMADVVTLPLRTDEVLARTDGARLIAPGVLQLRLDDGCGPACNHAGCASMSDAVVDAALVALAKSDIHTVELGGSAPERHRRFRELLILARALRRQVVVRANLAVLGSEEGSAICELLADQEVAVLASVPWHDALPVEAPELEGLRRLNALGYGRPGSGLRLDLVVDPPAVAAGRGRQALEDEWRREVAGRAVIAFDRLYRSASVPPAGIPGVANNDGASVVGAIPLGPHCLVHAPQLALCAG